MLRRKRNSGTVTDLVLALAISTGLTALAACKEPAAAPKPLPSPSPTFAGVTPLGSLGAAADARCNQPDLWQCNIPSDLVALCNEKETDKAPCNDKAWSKVLFDRIQKLKSGDVQLDPCVAATLYVNTQIDELLLREKPEGTTSNPTANVIGDTPRGSSVTCIGIVKGTEWTKVKTLVGTEGFMASKYLSDKRPGAAGGGSGGGTAGGTGSSATGGQACKDPDKDGFCICYKWGYDHNREVDRRWFSGIDSCAALNNKPYYERPWVPHDKKVTVGCRDNKDRNLLNSNDCICSIRWKESISHDGKVCPSTHPLAE